MQAGWVVTVVRYTLWRLGVLRPNLCLQSSVRKTVLPSYDSYSAYQITITTIELVN